MKNIKSNKLSIMIIPILIALFNLTIIFYPGEMISAAKEGISLWFNTVFPSLLPFMIGTNLLVQLGAIKFIGTLLEPIMQPLFGVSGIGAFPLITGMTSGYPMGAKVTANLREQGELTKTEAQKLIGFVNNSGPLFILGTVGIGMFKSAKAGYFIIVVHYLSAILTGLLFRYYKRDIKKQNKTGNKNLLRKAYRNMAEDKKHKNLPFSRIFAESVIQSMDSMVQIGGFIILFSVLVQILEVSDMASAILHILRTVSSPFNISDDIINALIYGAMEVTNGVKKVSSESFNSHQLIAAACMISFGGLSIHAQSISFISKTDIQIGLYFISKLIHAAIALVVGILAYPLFNFDSGALNPAFSYEPSPRTLFYYSFLIFFSALILIFITGFFIAVSIQITKKSKKYTKMKIIKKQ